MMSLWAPNATFTIGPGQTLTGKEEIRSFWLTKAKVFKPENQWVSDTPAYKIRMTANGDQGHAVLRVPLHRREDGKAAAITAADQEVARIDGHWLITGMVEDLATLSP